MSEKDAEIAKLRAEVERLADLLTKQCMRFDDYEASGDRLPWFVYATDDVEEWWLQQDKSKN